MRLKNGKPLQEIWFYASNSIQPVAKLWSLFWAPRAGFSVQVLIRLCFAAPHCGLFPAIPGAGSRWLRHYRIIDRCRSSCFLAWSIIENRASHSVLSVEVGRYFGNLLVSQDWNPGHDLRESIMNPGLKSGANVTGIFKSGLKPGAWFFH